MPSERSPRGSTDLWARPTTWPFAELSEPLRVNVDPGQFEQVVVNLVLNARHATPEGGRLHLRIRRMFVGAGEAAARDMAAGEYAVLDVEDTGIGMAPEVVERAFEPFYTTRANEGGSGLGLASAYGIVDRAGGHITIDSEPGVGTTVSLYLPLTDEPVPAEMVAVGSSFVDSRTRAQLDRVRTGDEAAGELVVVVDDERAILESTERILQAGGYHVVTVSDPLTALDVVQNTPIAPSLLLSDIRMPDMNGSDLVAKTRARHPEIGVLLMSGYAEDLDGSRDDGLTRSGQADVRGRPPRRRQSGDRGSGHLIPCRLDTRPQPQLLARG